MSDPAAVPHPVLVCVDMQPAFLRVIPDADRLLKRVAFAIAAARGIEMPLVFTEQVPEKLGGTAPELTALAPTSAVYPKVTFSALADDTIRHAIVRDEGAEHLLICGIETPVCVYQTALAAQAEGLEVTILSDAIGARRAEDARACLDTLIRAGVHVLPSETVFYSLLRDVKHPFFKAYTQLVKTHA